MLYQIFAKVLAMGLIASPVIVAVLCIRGMMHHFPKKYRYLLWAIVLIRLTCPVLLSSPVSLFNLISQNQEMPLSNPNRTGGNLPGSPAPAQSQDKTDGALGISNTFGIFSQLAGISKPDAAFQPDSSYPSDSAFSSDNAFLSGNASPSGNASRPESVPQNAGAVVRYGVLVWLIGVSVILLKNLCQTFRMKKSLERAVRYEGNIYECDNIPSPFVMGIVRPRIYIPFRLAPDERDYILKHEQYHLRRKDHIVKAFAFILVCIYWFHPLVWLSYFLMIRDMEMSCDEYVLQTMPADTDIRKSYSRSLLGFATNQRNFAAGLLSFGETDTRKRVKNVLHFKKHGKWIGVIAFTIVIIAGAVCLTNASAGKSGNAEKNAQNADADGAAGKVADNKDADCINADNKNADNKNADNINADNKSPEATDANNAGQDPNTAVIANGTAHGYQVRIAYLADGTVPDKESLTFGMYEGRFEIQTYQNGVKCAAYTLSLADKMYFPADGFDLAINDYDGDGDADDFALGQGQMPLPAMGNFMTYHFFTVNEDGTIEKHSLSTEDGYSLFTLPDDFSKSFACKDGEITYQTFGEEGTKEETARIQRSVPADSTDNTFLFEDRSVSLPSHAQNPVAYTEGKAGIIRYYDKVADTNVMLCFGKKDQQNYLRGKIPYNPKRAADELWSYFVGNKENLIQVQFQTVKNGKATVILFWEHSGIQFYMCAEGLPQHDSYSGKVPDNWEVLAKTAAYIANDYFNQKN